MIFQLLPLPQVSLVFAHTRDHVLTDDGSICASVHLCRRYVIFTMAAKFILTVTVFPLFGERLFEAIGVDWGVGMLAFLTLGLGGPFFPLVSNSVRSL